MSEPTFSMGADDDLPRTIRREREAREREAREARERAAGVSVPTIEHDLGLHLPAPSATVTAIDIPFFRLMAFLIKAVIAAIPALIVLTAVLWLIGRALVALVPQLVDLKIDIQIYSPHAAADARTQKALPGTTTQAHPVRK